MAGILSYDSRAMRSTHRVVAPSLEQVLDFCAEEPVERVYLEDVARHGSGRFAGVVENGSLTSLCYLGANVVPSGTGCGALAWEVVRTPGRMVIGRDEPVNELWDAAAARLPPPRLDRPGQPVYVIEEAPVGAARIDAAMRIRVGRCTLHLPGRPPS
jgi:hypothetical protein